MSLYLRSIASEISSFPPPSCLCTLVLSSLSRLPVNYRMCFKSNSTRNAFCSVSSLSSLYLPASLPLPSKRCIAGIPNPSPFSSFSPVDSSACLTGGNKLACCFPYSSKEIYPLNYSSSLLSCSSLSSQEKYFSSSASIWCVPSSSFPSLFISNRLFRGGRRRSLRSIGYSSSEFYDCNRKERRRRRVNLVSRGGEKFCTQNYQDVGSENELQNAYHHKQSGECTSSAYKSRDDDEFEDTSDMLTSAGFCRQFNFGNSFCCINSSSYSFPSRSSSSVYSSSAPSSSSYLHVRKTNDVISSSSTSQSLPSSRMSSRIYESGIISSSTRPSSSTRCSSSPPSSSSSSSSSTSVNRTSSEGAERRVEMHETKLPGGPEMDEFEKMMKAYVLQKTFDIQDQLRELERRLESMHFGLCLTEIHMKEYVLDKVFDIEDEIREVSFRTARGENLSGGEEKEKQKGAAASPNFWIYAKKGDNCDDVGNETHPHQENLQQADGSTSMPPDGSSASCCSSASTSTNCSSSSSSGSCRARGVRRGLRAVRTNDMQNDKFKTHSVHRNSHDKPSRY